MRSAIICFALLLSALSAQAGGVQLDRATTTYLEGSWMTQDQPWDRDGRDRVYYEFEFKRSGGIVRYADSIDTDEWREILSVKRKGQIVRVRMRDKSGHVRSQRFRLESPDALLELDDTSDKRYATLKRQPSSASIEGALAFATVRYFSDLPPDYATFTHKPWAHSVDEACNKLPNAKSFVRLNLLAPSGAWLVRESDEGIEDWSVAAATEEPKTKTLALRLSANARRPANNARDRTVHLERITGDRIRVPEWNEDFFRCTARR
jgi:hypothetical protein